jgi:hypothetical protein
MNLREFLAETEVQIVEGVKDAQSRTTEHGASVNPRIFATKDSEKYGVFVATGKAAQMVQFDVALTTTEGTGTKGGIGVFTGVINRGSSGQSQSESSSISRVKFSVPLTLPEGPQL